MMTTLRPFYMRNVKPDISLNHEEKIGIICVFGANQKRVNKMTSVYICHMCSHRCGYSISVIFRLWHGSSFILNLCGAMFYMYYKSTINLL